MVEIVLTVLIVGLMFFVATLSYWDGHRKGYYEGWKQATVLQKYKKSVSEELIHESANN